MIWRLSQKLSPPRKRGPIFQRPWLWVPAYAGTTSSKTHRWIALLRRGERRCRLLQHEVVLDLEERRGDGLAGRRFARRPLDEIDDQRLLHAVDHVGLDELVATLEQMGDAAMVARRADGEVDVGGPHVADIGALHQLAHGAVHRDGIGDRRDGADDVAAVAL